MQNWQATCPDGFTKSVMANTKEEAITMFMADADMQSHLKTNHPDMATKTPEEMMAMMQSMVQPVQAAQ